MLVRSPFFRKIEFAREGERNASYGGIAVKCVWFCLLCFVGAAAGRFIPLPAEAGPPLWIGLAVAVICPFLAYWFPMTTIVTGSLYSVVQGFLLTLICQSYAAEYGSLIWVAVGVTAGVFLLLLFLYASGIIRVNRKFRAAVLTIFLLSIIASAAVWISSFFTPVFSELLFGNGPIGIAVAAASLLIAVVNLVFEFDFTAELVRDGACKRYEWVAAYGIFMSVILIFVRVLELLSRLKSTRE